MHLVERTIIWYFFRFELTVVAKVKGKVDIQNLGTFFMKVGRECKTHVNNLL